LAQPGEYPRPQPKRQIDRFSHFCTADGRVSTGMPGHVLSPNNFPFSRGSGPHLIHASLRPPESITQTASRSVQPFVHKSRQSLAILYNRPPLSTLKLPLSTGIWAPSNTLFLAPIRAHNSNGISIGSGVFAQITAQCPYTSSLLLPSKLPLPAGDVDPI